VPAEQLEHFTIECGDLEKTRHFYCRILGLSAGFRPEMEFEGYWLYCGGVPVVHLMKHAGEPARRSDTTGRLDHIAFKSSDPETMFARFREHGIGWEENRLWDVPRCAEGPNPKRAYSLMFIYAARRHLPPASPK
jgi:catechol 2,3-dioxygenase-like lactoylglutathione lyase family enzyme